MAYARYESRLNQRASDGAPAKAHLEASARRKNSIAEKARAALVAPPYPEAVGYLLTWAYALYGRSGLGDMGFAPLSYTTIMDWARLMDLAIAPHEVSALIELDGVLRHPDPKKADPKGKA
jgi:hypothetical protein